MTHLLLHLSSLSDPSLCIISVFLFTLCSIQSASTFLTAIGHHAILVLILMPNLIVATPCPVFVSDASFFKGFLLQLGVQRSPSPRYLGISASSRTHAQRPFLSSFPCIERSVSLNPSHALQFPFIPLSIPRTALYVAVLVLLHLFFSSPLRLTVSAINRGVRPPHVILHAVRLAERFVSTAHKHAVELSLSPRIHVEEVWQVPWLIRSSAKRGDDTHGEFNKYGV